MRCGDLAPRIWTPRRWSTGCGRARAWRARTWPRRCQHARAVRGARLVGPGDGGARAGVPRRGLRLRHQAEHPAAPRGDRDARRRCSRRRRRRPRSLAGGFDGVFLSNGPGRPGGHGVRRRGRPRAARQGADVRHLPGPPAARAGARGPDVQAAVRPPRREPAREEPRGPGVVEITSHNHGFAVDPQGWTRGPTARARGAETDHGAAELTHWNLNDGTLEGLRCIDVPAFSRAVPPRGGARAARLALPVPGVPRR